VRIRGLFFFETFRVPYHHEKGWSSKTMFATLGGNFIERPSKVSA